MPLRDHFHAPIDDISTWEELHGGWPMEIVRSLSRVLPSEYVAGPRVHHGAFVEVDVSAYEKDRPTSNAFSPNGGGTATAVWAPPMPTRSMASDLPDTDEYEVRIYDAQRGRRLVAAIEIVSPANKVRPEHRRAFLAKCAALLHQQVAVSIVDLVTSRHSNLYADLLDLLGQAQSPASDALIYAVACRYIPDGDRWRFQTWEQVLSLGKPLPTLPLWLNEELAVPLNLEESYEETCRLLRIP